MGGGISVAHRLLMLLGGVLSVAYVYRLGVFLGVGGVLPG